MSAFILIFVGFGLANLDTSAYANINISVNSAL